MAPFGVAGVPMPMVACYAAMSQQMVEKRYANHFIGLAPAGGGSSVRVNGSSWHRKPRKRFRRSAEKFNDFMVLLVRIELTTSPLPRGCSTTELQQRRRGRWRFS